MGGERTPPLNEMEPGKRHAARPGLRSRPCTAAVRAVDLQDRARSGQRTYMLLVNPPST